MPVTVYRYDDVGAPTLAGQSAGSLIAVLDACLVNGYGSKSPAGWTKPFAGANLAAYKQGGGCGFYLRINDGSGTIKANAVGYESMSDIDTGVNAFPTAAQSAPGLYVTLSSAVTSAARQWVLVADEKRFYLWVGHSFTTYADIATAGSLSPIFFFGDIVSYKQGDPYCCQIIGAASIDADYEYFGMSATLGSTTTYGHYIARQANGSGGSASNSKYMDYYGANQSATIGRSTIAYPDPVSGALNLSRIPVSNGSTTRAVRGRLPGAWAPLNLYPGSNGDTFSGAGDLAGREFMLLNCANRTNYGRVAIEISDTWD